MRDDKREALQKPRYANIAAIDINKARDFNRKVKTNNAFQLLFLFSNKRFDTPSVMITMIENVN